MEMTGYPIAQSVERKYNHTDYSGTLASTLQIPDHGSSYLLAMADGQENHL